MKLNLYSKLIIGLFLIAIAVSFLGINFNHDILYLTNLLTILYIGKLFHKNKIETVQKL